ncbi:RloB family protein [Parabacteroides sp. ZJ-118]|uniref:RloB family protein n=1 Tax=Parabacteroides sp. ZJ-118 TaxID=2709398 RepID=UPI0013EC9EA9|nr:RloB family protein [Parabacteroides sp. ZJ-118]
MAAKKIKIDNASLKFKKQSQKREHKIIRCSVLIVCEGTKTEPNYFEAFSERQRGIIVYDVEVKGLGRGTKDVVEKAIELKNKNNYDRVWAVFDKDDIPAKDFNRAIEEGQNNDVEVAWSNEAFELWYLYHFHNVTTGVSRKDYEEKISVAVNASPRYKSKRKYKYAKNDPNNYEIMTKYGSINSALRYAEAKHFEYTDSRYARQNPCTTVYRLVRQLLGMDEELNAELIAKTEEN